MTVIYILSDRVDCIDEEGVAKGLLWCGTQPKTQIERPIYYIQNFIQGSLWPIHVAQYATHIVSHQQPAHGAQKAANNADMSYGEEYLCREMMSDVRAGDALAKQRMQWHFRDGIFGKDDGGAVLRMKALATEHYGHEPSRDELGKFSAESLRLAIPVCMHKPSLTVEEAIFIGAESVAPDFSSGSLK